MKISNDNYSSIRQSTMVILALILIGVLLIPSVKAEDCSKLEWTKSSARVQGGGWIWFPGKATSDIRSTSIISAEGEALSYEAGECGMIHTRTKFHEKCTEQNVNGTFTTYARASIKAKYCSQAMSSIGSSNVEKISNPILTRRLNAYKMSNAENTIKDSCNANQIFNCTLEHFAAKDAGNYFLAAAYAKRGCLFGKAALCNSAALALVEARMIRESIAWANQGCIQGNKISCGLRDKIHSIMISQADKGVAIN